MKTPGRADLWRCPTRALAEAIADEWNAQGEKIDPRAMPLTGLANAAIDRIAPDPAAFARGLAAYGESDLLCYRAEGPAPLVARQAELWDPILAWAQQRYDVDVRARHRRHPHAAAAPRRSRGSPRRSRRATPFELAGLSPLVTVSGSLLIALALAEGAIGLDDGLGGGHARRAMAGRAMGRGRGSRRAALAAPPRATSPPPPASSPCSRPRSGASAGAARRAPARGRNQATMISPAAASVSASATNS